MCITRQFIRGVVPTSNVASHCPFADRKKQSRFPRRNTRFMMPQVSTQIAHFGMKNQKINIHGRASCQDSASCWWNLKRVSALWVSLNFCQIKPNGKDHNKMSFAENVSGTIVPMVWLPWRRDNHNPKQHKTKTTIAQRLSSSNAQILGFEMSEYVYNMLNC